MHNKYMVYLQYLHVGIYNKNYYTSVSKKKKDMNKKNTIIFIYKNM